MQKLTPKLQETLIQIHKFHSKHGYMPSYAEIAVSIGGNALLVGTVQHRIHRLIRLGYLNAYHNKARSLEFAEHIEFQGQKIPILGTCD